MTASIANSQVAGGLVPIDYTGQHGGLLAMAFAAGVTFATSILLLVAKFMWKTIGGVKDAEIASLKALMTMNEKRCEERDTQAQTRILQLETMLWMHGPQQLRADIQSVISEQHLEMRQVIENGQLGKGDRS